MAKINNSHEQPTNQNEALSACHNKQKNSLVTHKTDSSRDGSISPNKMLDFSKDNELNNMRETNQDSSVDLTLEEGNSSSDGNSTPALSDLSKVSIDSKTGDCKEIPL